MPKKCHIEVLSKKTKKNFFGMRVSGPFLLTGYRLIFTLKALYLSQRAVRLECSMWYKRYLSIALLLLYSLAGPSYCAYLPTTPIVYGLTSHLSGYISFHTSSNAWTHSTISSIVSHLVIGTTSPSCNS